MKQEEVNINEVIRVPEVKLLKLITGESLIAMVEFSNKDDGYVTLYNPYKVIMGDIASLNLNLKQGQTSVFMEEWLPFQIVSEQVCQLLESDIITMVDVNERFCASYTASVLKRAHLDEIIRRGDVLKNTLGTIASDEELDEMDQEDLNDKLQEALKKFKDSIN